MLHYTNPLTRVRMPGRLGDRQYLAAQRVWRFWAAQRRAVEAALYAAPGVQVTIEGLPPVACSVLEARTPSPRLCARVSSSQDVALGMGSATGAHACLHVQCCTNRLACRSPSRTCHVCATTL